MVRGRDANRLDDLLQHAAEVVIELAPDGCILFVSDAVDKTKRSRAGGTRRSCWWKTPLPSVGSSSEPSKRPGTASSRTALGHKAISGEARPNSGKPVESGRQSRAFPVEQNK
jgi:hypothetical protein